MVTQKHFMQARILVIDDEQANVRLLRRILVGAGYVHVRSTTDPEAVLGLVEGYRPDLLLLDLKMPRMDGFEILGLLPSVYDLPVLVLTADPDREVKRKALAAGARDFLTKPFDVDEVLLRIANMLDIRFLTLNLKIENTTLEERVRDRTRELEESTSKPSNAWRSRRSIETTTPVSTRGGSDGWRRSLLKSSGSATKTSGCWNPPPASTTWGRSASRIASPRTPEAHP